jgi:hypothetical protein
MQRSKQFKVIKAEISPQNFTQLKEIAKAEGISLPDFIRDAVARRCRELGYEVNLLANKSGGGKRPGSGRKVKHKNSDSAQE